MQGLLIDHLVEHRDGENIYFSLTCTICGTVWKSAALPGLTRKAAAEEAAKQGYIQPEDIRRLIAFRDNPADESWMR